MATKITLNTLASLANETTHLTELNQNFTTIADQIDLLVSRDGESPNTLTAALDINSQRLLNLIDGATAQEPVTKSQLDAASDLTSSNATTTNYTASATGAIERTIQAMMDEQWISVVTMGAVGDGASPSADQIAFDNAVATGLNVFVPLPSVQYDLTTSVAISTAGQKIFGAGRSRIVQAGTNANADVFAVTADGVEITGLHGTPGTISSSVAEGAFVHVNGATRVAIHHNEISGHRRSGILFQDATYSSAHANYIHDSVVNPATENHTQAGVDIRIAYNSNHCSVYGNIIKDGAGSGVSIETVNANDSADYNSVTGNIIFGAKMYGILLYRNAAVTDTVLQNVITHNIIDTVYGNIEEATNGFVFGAGIYNQGAEHTIIANNNIRNTNIDTLVETLAPGGIGVANAGSVDIHDNTIVDTIYHGILVQDANSLGLANSVIDIHNNTIVNAAKAGIQAKDIPLLSIKDNEVTNSTSQGVLVRDTTTSNTNLIFVTGNTIRQGSSSGAEVQDGNYADVSSNVVGSNGSTGINVAAVDTKVQGNRVSGGTTRGITIAATVLDGIVSGNIVKNNTTDGMEINGPVRLLDNIVSGNGTDWIGDFQLRRTLINADATPTVKNGRDFLTGDTTAITDFDDGHDGQKLFIKFDHTKTITHGSPIKLNGSANFVGAAGDTLTLENIEDVWYEQSRMVA